MTKKKRSGRGAPRRRKGGASASKKRKASTSKSTAVPIDQEALKKALLESFTASLQPQAAPGTTDASSAGAATPTPPAGGLENADAVQQMVQNALPQLFGQLAQQLTTSFQGTLAEQTSAAAAQAAAAHDEATSGTASEAPDTTPVSPALAEAGDIGTVAPVSDPEAQTTEVESESAAEVVEPEQVEVEAEVVEADQQPEAVEAEQEAEVIETEQEPEVVEAEQEAEQEPEVPEVAVAVDDSDTNRANVQTALKQAVDRYVQDNVDDAEVDADGNKKVNIDGRFLADHGAQLVASLLGQLTQTLAAAAIPKAAPDEAKGEPPAEEASTKENVDASPEVPSQATPSQATPDASDQATPDGPGKVSFNFDLGQLLGQFVSAAQAGKPAKPAAANAKEDAHTKEDAHAKEDARTKEDAHTKEDGPVADE